MLTFEELSTNVLKSNTCVHKKEEKKWVNFCALSSNDFWHN